MVRIGHRWNERLLTGVGYVIGNRVFDIDTLAEATGQNAKVVFGYADIGLDKKSGIRLEYSHGEEDPDFIQDKFGVYYYFRW